RPRHARRFGGGARAGRGARPARDRPRDRRAPHVRPRRRARLMLDPGAIVGGRYAVQKPLGTGGWGEVYEARDTESGRRVAIKVLRDDVAADPEALARFEREARA